MPAFSKFQSRVREGTPDGVRDSIVYSGSRAEIESLASEHAVNELGENGLLKSIRIYQESGNLWCCELRYESGSGDVFCEPPPTEFGKKSAVLHCGMLSLQLKSHPDYLANWDHYLAAAPGVTQVPSWWATAKSCSLSHGDAQKYAWLKDPTALPSDTKGRWHIIKDADPEFDGMDHYDYATYSITERARFQNAKAAGKMVAEKLNRIGKPVETFGLDGIGQWKCDAAEVNWTGKYWYATLTWTLSGNARGWNRIYK